MLNMDDINGDFGLISTTKKIFISSIIVNTLEKSLERKIEKNQKKLDKY
jgi:hypothetical protein